jgi:hypothetical protein
MTRETTKRTQTNIEGIQKKNNTYVYIHPSTFGVGHCVQRGL